MGLTDQLINSNNTSLFNSQTSPTNNYISAGGTAVGTGNTRFSKESIGKGFAMFGKSVAEGAKNMDQGSPMSGFAANNWQDIGGGEQNGLQPTGMAGASMNLYLQKMLSNPAIMQLLQQRMGVQNG
jgi:hypothetical protein